MHHLGTEEYINRVWAKRYKEWKYEMHLYYNTCAFPVDVSIDHPQSLQRRLPSGSGYVVIFGARHFCFYVAKEGLVPRLSLPTMTRYANGRADT
ncbi:hypothetical protein C1H46_003059 [Malus baccata]|uniref:Uncharacterized protein n=1 Tax=Malus baccata TaxID=106549 RepID=A0A540NJY8_MALBA|nr:hypothetical protein C1H46_003059 [Malus baccata]